jgi:hypothetical protein
MARQAGVKLTLENAQFLTSIKRSGEAVRKMSTDSGKTLRDQFGAGADAAKRSIMGLSGELRSASRWALTLGGAFTLGNAIKDAVHLQRSYRQIAFGVRDASGAMLKAVDVQRITERAAAATGQSNEDMAQSFRELLDASADVGFSTKALAAVGTTAIATGTELGTLTNLADQLNSKFGVSGDDMLSTMAQVVGAAKQGGPSLEQFSEASAAVGQELMAAGITGKRGLDFMLGALVATDQPLKSLPKQIAGVKAVLRGLGEKTELTKLAGQLGIDPKKLINDKDAIARLKRIFGSGKAGVKALLGSMHEGEEKVTMKTLFTDPFEKALAKAQASGLKGKDAVDQALVVFDGQIRDFGKSTMTAAQLQDRAAEERNGPEAKLTEALNRLKTAFGQPEIIKAIDDLAKHLPELAALVAKVVGLAAKHPILAGGAAIAGKVGLDVLGGAASSALTGAGGALVKKLLGKGGGSAAGSAAGAAAEAAASGIERFHQMGLGGGITGEMLGAAPEGAITAAELGAAGIAPGFMGGGLAASAAAAALPIAGIGAAGLAAGYGIHRAYENEDDVMSELSSATAAGFGSGGLKGKRAALERLQAAQAAAQDADVGGGVMDWFARGVTGIDSRKGAQDQMKLAGEAIAKLQADIARLANPPKADEKAADAKPKPVSLDQTAPRLIAEATKTALGGMVLTVRMATGETTGIGKIITGNRGPANAPPARQGGAV